MRYRIDRIEIDESMLALTFVANHITLDLIKVGVLDFEVSGVTSKEAFDMLDKNPSNLFTVHVDDIPGSSIHISLGKTNYMAILSEIAIQSGRYLNISNDGISITDTDDITEEIHWKRNVKAFTYTEDYLMQIDKIQPVGYASNGSNIVRPWIGSGTRELIKDYPHIKVGDRYNGNIITTSTINGILDTLGEEYLDKHHKPEKHVDVDFVVLSNLEKYKHLVLDSKIKVGNVVKVTHTLFTTTLRVVRVDYDVVKEKYINIETGKIQPLIGGIYGIY